MSGKVVYRVEGESSPLVGLPGQLLAIPAHTRHEIVACSRDLTLWVFELCGVSALSWLGRPTVMTPHRDWTKAVSRAARGLWLRPPATADVRREQEHLWTAFECLNPASPRPSQKEPHPAVVRAKLTCESHLHGDLDVARIASEAGLSTSRLAHLFADEVGLTPLQYRNFARVQNFIRSSGGEEMNLMREALASGFGSYAQFHRVFRQVCGESPAVHFRWLGSRPDLDPTRTLSFVV